MKLHRALITTIEDWLHRDPALPRLKWLLGTLVIAPAIIPVTVWRVISFEEPERNPDFRKKPQKAPEPPA